MNNQGNEMVPSPAGPPSVLSGILSMILGNAVLPSGGSSLATVDNAPAPNSTLTHASARTSTDQFTVKSTREALYANPLLRVCNKQAFGALFDPTSRTLSDTCPTVSNPIRYAVYPVKLPKLEGPPVITKEEDLARFKYEPRQCTGKDHAAFPSLAEAFAENQHLPIRIHAVKRGILSGPTLESLQLGQSGLVPVLHSEESVVLALWGTRTLANVNLTPENDMQGMMKSMIAKALKVVEPTTLGQTVFRPDTALNEYDLNFTYNAIKTALHNPEEGQEGQTFNFYVYVNVEYIGAFEPLDADREIDWCGQKAKRGSESLRCVPNPCIMANGQAYRVIAAKNKDAVYDSFVFSTTALVNELKIGKGAKAKFPEVVKVKAFMSSLFPKLYLASTGTLIKKFSSGSLFSGTGRLPSDNVFKLDMQSGERCTRSADVMAEEARMLQRDIARQLLDGQPQSKRICMGDSRHGDVPIDQVYATEENFSNAFTAEMIPDFGEFMREFYLANNETAFDDGLFANPSSFNFAQVSLDAHFKNPLFWTCVVLWTGCECKQDAELIDMVRAFARIPEEGYDEKRIRDASCGLLHLLLLILGRVYGFLPAEHAYRFKVKVSTDEELDPRVDVTGRIKTIMNRAFPTTRGQTITLIQAPPEQTVDEWIYVAYRKTKSEDPMTTNDFEDALAVFRDPAQRDGCVQQLEDYLAERLAAAET